MTTPEQDGGAAQGTEERSTSQTSAQSSTTASAGMVSVPKAEWDNLTETVKRLSNEDRSTKDKAVKKVNERITKLEGDVQPLLARAVELVQGGASIESALKTANKEADDEQTGAAIKEMALAWKNGSLQLPRADNANGQSEDVTRVVAKYGLSETDTDVIEAMRNHKGAELKVALADIALARKDKPQLSAASATALSAAPAQQVDHGDLVAKLEKLQSDPIGNRKEIKEIESKLGW